ncbi:hypothetical protein ACRE_021440 [Hapsidospora chrysogenum ATCC 11550]|uniref:Uncharacterized protein n=1 Tax=Hapsidospora chrysogenum (strain ATCC 11550 / CBS 779.69 / DSM 880 / IAM 14645 / JCM 23072 / IMI 49137) TaxID=857340 RepID=A0A086TCL0_HAPC1|nr:hypothetical protein ACRE_021440 [Hapsidospora chrysogenum ATCC 11550]
MSGNSQVGQHGVYEAGDQRNYKDSEIKAMNSEPYAEGKQNSHSTLDSKDERTIANKLAAEECCGKVADMVPIQRTNAPKDDFETAMSKKDPTAPAKLHGNEPSKGAQIDAELQADDEQRLREKQGK